MYLEDFKMKQFLKKFKDFRLTAIVEAIAGAVAVVAALVILILYQTNQTQFHDYDGSEYIVSGFVGEPIPGMIFFLAGLLAIIFGIVAAYTSLPFIFKKDEKLEPNKLIPWFGVVCAGFAIVEVIFAFIMIGKEGSRHTVGVLIAAVFLILALLVQLLMIVPTLKVRVNKE